MFDCTTSRILTMDTTITSIRLLHPRTCLHMIAVCNDRWSFRQGLQGYGLHRCTSSNIFSLTKKLTSAPKNHTDPSLPPPHDHLSSATPYPVSLMQLRLLRYAFLPSTLQNRLAFVWFAVFFSFTGIYERTIHENNSTKSVTSTFSAPHITTSFLSHNPTSSSSYPYPPYQSSRTLEPQNELSPSHVRL